MINKVQLIGRVGKDPEMRHMANGEAVANFTVATSERLKDKQTGEVTERTEWHNVSAFRRLAEIIGEYVRKGSLVYIEGKIQTRKYMKDGVEHYATGILASELKLLGGKSESREQQPQDRRAPAVRQNTQKPNQGIGFDDLDDDVPF
jgi:single-strand DNA-binding protein